MNSWMTLIRPKWIVSTILVLAGTLLCIRLGIWQLDRLDQRRVFNANYTEISQMAPLVLNASSAENLLSMDYRRVVATGIYDPENNIVLRNQYHDNEPGYFLLTPLIFSDGTGVLVERGWIPAVGNNSPVDWRKYDQSGTVTVKGMIRIGESQSEVGGIPDPQLTVGQVRLDYWNIVNLERISKQIPYKMPLIFVQPDIDLGKTAPPYPYQPVVEITEGPHLGYALQWFTFASILFIGYPFFLRKQLRNRNYDSGLEEKE